MNEEELQGRLDGLVRWRVAILHHLPVENWDHTEETPHAKAQEPSTSASKNSKKKSRLSDAISKVKPKFDPSMRKGHRRDALQSSSVHSEDKTFEEYFNEYYKLDCEDFIGDTPVRFQYRPVEPNDFGLSIDEVGLRFGVDGSNMESGLDSRCRRPRTERMVLVEEDVAVPITRRRTARSARLQEQGEEFRQEEKSPAQCLSREDRSRGQVSETEFNSADGNVFDALR